MGTTKYSNPAVQLADNFLVVYRQRLPLYLTIFGEAARAGDSQALVHHQTCASILNARPVRELDLMGLAWVIRALEDPWMKYAPRGLKALPKPVAQPPATKTRSKP